MNVAHEAVGLPYGHKLDVRADPSIPSPRSGTGPGILETLHDQILGFEFAEPRCIATDAPTSHESLSCCLMYGRGPGKYGRGFDNILSFPERSGPHCHDHIGSLPSPLHTPTANLAAFCPHSILLATEVLNIRRSRDVRRYSLVYIIWRCCSVS